MDQFLDSWHSYRFRYCSVNNLGLIISTQDRVNFINQYKDSSDEGMRAWAELYESDERTRKLSRIVFSILFIPVIFFAILVVYFSIKKYMG